jgi:hypothetical protein
MKEEKKDKRPYTKNSDVLEKFKAIESTLTKFYHDFSQRFEEWDKYSQIMIVFSSLFWTLTIHICVWMFKYLIR